tara:strand:- start:325 stop:546 length:222 start_codon:yes stop_codon:yes gene_type:complete
MMKSGVILRRIICPIILSMIEITLVLAASSVPVPYVPEQMTVPDVGKEQIKLNVDYINKPQYVQMKQKLRRIK